MDKKVKGKTKLMLVLLTAFLVVGIQPVSGQYEEAAIKEVLREAYENGYHNEGIARNIELGFSPEFRAVTIQEGRPVLSQRSDWIDAVKEGQTKKNYPKTGDKRISLFYHRLEIDGDQAHIKLNIKQGGKPVATEYIELYKSEGGWLILSISSKATTD